MERFAAMVMNAAVAETLPIALMDIVVTVLLRTMAWIVLLMVLILASLVGYAPAFRVFLLALRTIWVVPSGISVAREDVLPAIVVPLVPRMVVLLVRLIILFGGFRPYSVSGVLARLLLVVLMLVVLLLSIVLARPVLVRICLCVLRRILEARVIILASLMSRMCSVGALVRRVLIVVR